MPVWLTGWLLKAAPYLAIAAAVLGGYAWLHGKLDKIDAQAAQITTLQTDLRAEKAARQADVAGLTSLSKGLAAAATDTRKDAQVLSETIDVQHPQVASAGLAAFLACLRASDDGRQCATAGTGAAAQPGATRAH